ncbi:MAG: amidohydrolase, partial [Gammaproteobacteria bacterium]
MRGALLSGLLIALPAGSALASPPPADLVFAGGVVHTADARGTRAAALAVRDGKIVFVGEDAGARALAGKGTRVVELDGRMLLPGFIDGHVHPGMAPNPRTALSLHGMVRREEIFERIRGWAAANPEAPWVLGDGWDEGAFLPSGKPTREMLDALVPDRPALLYDNAGHGAWVNSRALALAGISAATPDPVNGRIQRDARGEPSGMLHEDSAMQLVAQHVPPATPAEIRETLEVALSEMSRHGITGLQDAMATPGIATAFRELDREDRLPLHARLCLPHAPEKDDEAQIAGFIADRKALAGTRLRADCVKLFLDGAYGSHTLVLLEPYADQPERFGRGTLFIPQERLDRLVTRLDAEGFQLHMHAQGDGAVRAGLDAIAAARRANGARDARHTIAHLCLVDAADRRRFRELGVIANLSPLWMLPDPWETVFAPRLFGPERSARLFETRSFLADGVTVVFGTDWPVTGLSPVAGIETATTRRYPGGRDPHGQEDSPLVPGEAIDTAQA